MESSLMGVMKINVAQKPRIKHVLSTWAIKGQQILAFLGFLFFSSYLLAESILPVGCQAVKVQGESVTLDSKNSILVFIHNLTTADLWITHLSWASKLQTGNWSAVVIDAPLFVMNCVESRPGHEQQIPCEGAVALCQWPGVETPKDKKEQGALWVEEDKSLSALTAAVGARGLVLPLAK